MEIARDEEINFIVNQYLYAKRLPIGERSQALTEKFLDDAGLLDHVELLVSLECIYSEHVERQRKAQAQPTKRSIRKF